MCKDMCIDMRVDMCIGMCVGMYMAMCIDMRACIDLRSKRDAEPNALSTSASRAGLLLLVISAGLLL